MASLPARPLAVRARAGKAPAKLDRGPPRAAGARPHVTMLCDYVMSIFFFDFSHFLRFGGSSFLRFEVTGRSCFENVPVFELPGLASQNLRFDDVFETGSRRVTLEIVKKKPPVWEDTVSKVKKKGIKTKIFKMFFF